MLACLSTDKVATNGTHHNDLVLHLSKCWNDCIIGPEPAEASLQQAVQCTLTSIAHMNARPQTNELHDVYLDRD